MLEYWSNRGGVSRYVKFQHFAENILGLDDPKSCVDGLLAQFTVLSRVGYHQHNPVPQAMRLVKATGPERCFVISGTDQNELREVFEAKGLSKHFADVLGSPRKKHQHIPDILHAHHCSPEQALFVGDGSGDFDACQQTGVHFVYLAQMSEWRDAEQVLSNAPNVSRYDHWDQLLQALQIRSS
jgi:phosphoglycolate phosphatase-like HAD superfamily hydrolase